VIGDLTVKFPWHSQEVVKTPHLLTLEGGAAFGTGKKKVNDDNNDDDDGDGYDMSGNNCGCDDDHEYISLMMMMMMIMMINFFCFFQAIMRQQDYAFNGCKM
jgi:hypothetical protein